MQSSLLLLGKPRTDTDLNNCYYNKHQLHRARAIRLDKINTVAVGTPGNPNTGSMTELNLFQGQSNTLIFKEWLQIKDSGDGVTCTLDYLTDALKRQAQAPSDMDRHTHAAAAPGTRR